MIIAVTMAIHIVSKIIISYIIIAKRITSTIIQNAAGLSEGWVAVGDEDYKCGAVTLHCHLIGHL